jgi:hypothetical protein
MRSCPGFIRGPASIRSFWLLPNRSQPPETRSDAHALAAGVDRARRPSASPVRRPRNRAEAGRDDPSLSKGERVAAASARNADRSGQRAIASGLPWPCAQPVAHAPPISSATTGASSRWLPIANVRPPRPAGRAPGHARPHRSRRDPPRLSAPRRRLHHWRRRTNAGAERRPPTRRCRSRRRPLLDPPHRIRPNFTPRPASESMRTASRRRDSPRQTRSSAGPRPM